MRLFVLARREKIRFLIANKMSAKSEKQNNKIDMMYGVEIFIRKDYPYDSQRNRHITVHPLEETWTCEKKMFFEQKNI